MGLTSVLLLSYYDILYEGMLIGDFVMLNAYILQMYIPLNILGTMWRFIRSNMVDVEMVLELLEVDEVIKDPIDPIPSKVAAGEIEFKNVCFSYDKKLRPEDRKMIIENLSFKVPAGKSVAIVG